MAPAATFFNKHIIKFLLPSFLGIWIFLVPISLHYETNTVLGHVKEFLLELAAGWRYALVASVSAATAALACVARFIRPAWITRNHALYENLGGETVLFYAKLTAAPLALLACAAQYLPEFGGAAGLFVKEVSFIAGHLAPRVIVLAVVLGLFSPLIMDFGLVQFIAVFASPVMRPLFRVPGRSAVDCVASWLGSSSVAVVFTAKMYDAGYYTAREAASIVCCFSLAGIYNIYALAELLGIDYAMPKILLTVYSAMVLLAAILPRIWPISSIPDSYRLGHDIYKAGFGADVQWKSMLDKALSRGASRASKMDAAYYFRESCSIISALVFGTVPLMITFGTLLVFAAEVTPAINWIAAPAAFLLDAAGIVESDTISAAAVFSYVDHFLAAACGERLLTEEARFICVCLTVTGLINLTEVGLHVWHSNIPLGFFRMSAVYVIRILLSIFIIIPAARILL